MFGATILRVILALSVAGHFGNAFAAPGTTVWSGFLRAGPSRHERILDEIQRGTVVEMLACQGGWCLIRTGRARGWVTEDVFTPPRSPIGRYASRQSNGADCFQSLVPGRQSLHSEDICRGEAQ